MADREMIAATLAAAILQNTSNRPGIKGAKNAVQCYRQVLAELDKPEPARPPR